MQDFLYSKPKDEIDIRELFATLWAYKILIACTCALGLVLGGYKAINTNKEFTSIAIFKLDTGDTSVGVLNLSNLGSLSSLSKLGKNTPVPIDMFLGRVFIERIDSKLNFQDDPYFNTYNPNSVDPSWKSLIKRIINWQNLPEDTQEAIWQSITSNYAKNVVLDTTRDGAFKVVVTHMNAQRAAEVANTIMNEIISIEVNKKLITQDKQLSYLSTTLADALGDLEVSQSKLKVFALENSALPVENFAAGSFQLDALREQLGHTSELHEAVAALLLMLENKTTDQENYLSLRVRFPIIDQVEFRRVLGQNEIISSWSWPEISSVAAVYDTLSDRKNRLQSQINASQIDAERSSQALSTYAKLERGAKVAEATYTVLIEQVKAKSMAAGYRPDKTEIYEYASASIKPSAPNLRSFLALGAILGFILGAALALVFAYSRGVHHSKNSLLSGAQAQIVGSIKALMPLKNKSLNKIKIILQNKPFTILRDMAVEIHKSELTQVVITSSRSKLTSSNVARVLASYMQSNSMKISVIDFSSKESALDIDVKRLSVGSFVIAETSDNVSILRPDGDFDVMEMLSQRDFIKNLQSLSSTTDLLFLCADNEDAVSLLSALRNQKIFHITLAKRKRTKTVTLAHMRSILQIQGLLYD